MWSWRRGNVSVPVPALQEQKPEVIPVPVAPVPAPVAEVPTESPTPFFGCADVHTPHFGVTHTPLEGKEDA